MKLLLFLAVAFLAGVHPIQCTVTYDKKSLIINGKRRILLSGSIHYPRSTPDMWEDLIQKAKDGGLDVIDTYVFWNIHEPSPGNYNFGERYDLVSFIKIVQKAGLYVHLRIGPYICGEWNFGGFPVWLKYIPGISFRTDNEAFKGAMKGFSEKIVGMMKNENLFESQGGPIILSQIENEYGAQSKALGVAGTDYMNWAAKMAVQLDTGVPWVMCKQDDAPDPVINTCNGFYCDTFVPNKPYKPTMWTEAWTGWFTEFGGALYERPVQDLAFAVARFILKGGSFVNYYMYHGGTNFGRTSGGQFTTTTYDYNAPIDEYGLIRDPKYSHLKELHKAIKLCEPALVSADSNLTSLGPSQQAFVFSPSNNGRATCAAFLCNSDSKSAVSVVFNGKHYRLPPWSVSILPDCKNAIFNTAKIGSQTSRIRMIPTSSMVLSWERYDEDISSIEENPTVNAVGLLEQLNVTKDASDYLWYMTSVEISSSESFLRGGNKPTLLVNARAQAVHVFINGLLSGSAYGTNKAMRFKQTVPVNLHAGTNIIALLSITMGLPNIGTHFETWVGGVIGPILLQGLDRGRLDLTWHKWTYKVGLKGETMNLDTPEGVSSVDWIHVSAAVTNKKPLTWYKAYFNAPQENEPLALDMKSMGKGQVWINGRSIGRYWTVNAVGNCGTRCTYAGTYRESKCQLGCGKPTQRWYHVPRAWLKTTQNLLVVFEEIGGDISKINLVKRSTTTTTTSLCADGYQNHQTIQNSSQSEISHNPKVHLQCTSDQSIISSIKFASYGNPSGTCGTFQKGTCHALNSQTVIEKMCIGRKSCNMTVSNGYFQKDPCPNMLKRLTVEAVCSRT